jgi:hypothetical protein
MSTTRVQPFEEHFPLALDNLREALAELYLAASADPEQPQQVSREFGLHRNLTWKITRILRSRDASGILPYLPGPAGIELVVKAFKKAGAPRERLEAVDLAQREFEAMVEVHAGDRATLELMLESLGLGDSQDTLEASRKMAYRGNSGIWGIQARARLRAAFVAPNAERPDFIDLAQISGLVDLRRFRPDATWPLFHRQGFNDDGTPRATRIEPLDEDLGELADTLIWREFCSDDQPEVRVVPTRLGERYELVGDTIGNRGLTTCVYGGLVRGFAPRYRDELNSRGEFFAEVNAPTENLLFDLFMHRELVDEMKIEVHLLHSDSATSGAEHEVHLPCQEQLRLIDSVPPRVRTSLIPRYPEIVAGVHARAGWNPEDFRLMRFEMKHPPMPSSVVMRYELP